MSFKELGGMGEKIENGSNLHDIEDWSESYDKSSFSSNFRLPKHRAASEELFSSTYQQKEQEELFSSLQSMEEFLFTTSSPLIQSCQEVVDCIKSDDSELPEPQKDKPEMYSSASLGLLRRYGSRFSQVNVGSLYDRGNDEVCTRMSGKKLSTNDKIQSAGHIFIQSFAQKVENSSMISHPFASSFIGLSDEEARDVELIQCLLASAEKVGQQQFSRACQLLSQCEELSSADGTPVQRLVYYFSEALQERIDVETGRIKSNSLGKKQVYDADEAVVHGDPSIISVHQKVPFFQVIQFTGVQAIVENVSKARRVHLIDLMIGHGTQATVIMQALAARSACPLEHLKVTAVNTTERPNLDDMGKRLISFAQSMNLPFSFHVVLVSDMLSLKKDLFELDEEEAVAVYSPYILWDLISKPNQVDCVMRVMRQINPCVMVVAEIEANLNSPVFVNRFTEALFYYGALFDALDDCMGQSDLGRSLVESLYFAQAIRNTVAAEGDGRKMRMVKINVWRAFFARFGMDEIELSKSNLYQADLVLKDFACRSSCTLEKDGECLIIGWKGTSLFSMSAWKFS